MRQHTKEADVITCRNADVEAVAVKAVEGKPMYGGDMLVKPLIKGDQMTFLEIHYAAGVGAPLHTHTHESVAYVVKGKVKSTVGLEVWVSTGEGGPQDWRREFQAWKEAGVTHVTVNSTYARGPHKRIAGRTVADHMAAMKQYRAAVADLL